MVKTIKDKHNCTRLSTIKAINYTWIAKMILLVSSVDPNISNKELNTILKENVALNYTQYGFKGLGQKQMSLWKEVIISNFKDFLYIYKKFLYDFNDNERSTAIYKLFLMSFQTYMLLKECNSGF
jgi:hypothetical protein